MLERFIYGRGVGEEELNQDFNQDELQTEYVLLAASFFIVGKVLQCICERITNSPQSAEMSLASSMP